MRLKLVEIEGCVLDGEFVDCAFEGRGLSGISCSLSVELGEDSFDWLGKSSIGIIILNSHVFDVLITNETLFDVFEHPLFLVSVTFCVL